MLPPAGQIFEQLHFLENFGNLDDFFVPLKQWSSRGAASGGSFSFRKNTPSCVSGSELVLFVCHVKKTICEQSLPFFRRVAFSN